MRTLTVALLPLALAAGPALAGAPPGYYLVSVYDNEGLRTLDFRYWAVQQKPGTPSTTWPEIGLGWNVTKRWYTEFLLSYIGGPGQPNTLADYNWQNDFLLTQGQYPFDLALHSNIKWANESYEGKGIEFGLVFQTELAARLQFNANLFLERHVGGDDGSKPTEMNYQWQLKYRWRPGFQFGAQGFGELGEWSHWAPRDKQSHRAGPAIFGTLPLGNGQNFRYEAAYLYGSIYTKHSKMVTARLRYEF